eukprot:gene275-365_t
MFLDSNYSTSVDRRPLRVERLLPSFCNLIDETHVVCDYGISLSVENLYNCGSYWWNDGFRTCRYLYYYLHIAVLLKIVLKALWRTPWRSLFIPEEIFINMGNVVIETLQVYVDKLQDFEDACTSAKNELQKMQDQKKVSWYRLLKNVAHIRMLPIAGIYATLFFVTFCVSIPLPIALIVCRIFFRRRQGLIDALAGCTSPEWDLSEHVSKKGSSIMAISSNNNDPSQLQEHIHKLKAEKERAENMLKDLQQYRANVQQGLSNASTNGNDSSPRIPQPPPGIRQATQWREVPVHQDLCGPNGQNSYFWNTQTNETTWVRPDDFVLPSSKLSYVPTMPSSSGDDSHQNSRKYEVDIEIDPKPIMTKADTNKKPSRKSVSVSELPSVMKLKNDDDDNTTESKGLPLRRHTAKVMRRQSTASKKLHNALKGLGARHTLPSIPTFVAERDGVPMFLKERDVMTIKTPAGYVPAQSPTSMLKPPPPPASPRPPGSDTNSTSEEGSTVHEEESID